MRLAAEIPRIVVKSRWMQFWHTVVKENIEDTFCTPHVSPQSPHRPHSSRGCVLLWQNCHKQPTPIRSHCQVFSLGREREAQLQSLICPSQGPSWAFTGLGRRITCVLGKSNLVREPRNAEPEQSGAFHLQKHFIAGTLNVSHRGGDLSLPSEKSTPLFF